MGNEKNPAEKLKSIVQELLPEVVGLREELHRQPELSWKEYQTTEKIKSFLSRHGIGNLNQPLSTGGWIDFVTNPENSFLMLRADIDALPIQDRKEVAYRSQKEGICHACGHDVHTSIMAGVAAAIQRMEEKPKYNLRIVFQPAEEPIPSGAPEMIKQGVLEDVKYVLGLHVDPGLPAGTIGLASGWVNMQSIRLDIKFTGKGGHSARPFQAADLIWLASRIIQDGYQKVYRSVNFLQSPVILTFTEIQAGQGYNIIPNQLELTGTLRVAVPAVRDQLLGWFKEYLSVMERENRCTINFDYSVGAPAIFNDPELMQQLIQNTKKIFGDEVPIDTEYRTPGGDDFSYYVQELPGAMIRFGVGQGEDTPGLHDGRFDVPSSVLSLALQFFAQQVYLIE
ncbi:MAG: amidohydrolase [Calditrichaeota bacterium]|nr:MAG: amidohydrolase [Calditrichota bacterium]